MHETKLLESALSEYNCLVFAARRRPSRPLHTERLVRDLCRAHEWTDSGARALVSLANDYGAFMLRNALALAIALDKEDGDLGL